MEGYMSGDMLYRFPLLTAAEVEDSPSRRDGVDSQTEVKILAKLGRIIYATTQSMYPPMSAGTASIAMTFCARFYTRRSIKRNQPDVIGIASLVLAAKCNDEPRHLEYLVKVFMKYRYSKENPSFQAFVTNEQRVRHLMQVVQEAEKLLMFTLNFDFNVDPLIVPLLRTIKDVPWLEYIRHNKEFQQLLLSTSNDIMQRDARIVLQYRGEDIGLAIVQLAFKVMKQKGRQISDPVPDPPTDQPWYVSLGLSEEINSQLQGYFNKWYHVGEDGQQQTTYAESVGMPEQPSRAATPSVMGGAALSTGGVKAMELETGAPVQQGNNNNNAALEKAAAAKQPKINAANGGGGGGRKMISFRVNRPAPGQAAPKPSSWHDDDDDRETMDAQWGSRGGTPADFEAPAFVQQPLPRPMPYQQPPQQRPIHPLQQQPYKPAFSLEYDDLDNPSNQRVALEYSPPPAARAAPPPPAADEESEPEEGEIC